MNRVVSADALCRALERIGEAASMPWMRPMLMHSVRQALDIYDAGKPGRPSQVWRTF